MSKINDLRINYGNIEAVKGVSLEIPEKSIVTLIGANGTGKSTTLRAIAGLVKASADSIQFDGTELLGVDIPNIMSEGITLVPEDRRAFPDMTVIENIKVGVYLRTNSLGQDIEWAYSLFPRPRERNQQLAGTLSEGKQQMLAVARAFMSHPELMVTDKPSLGLAPLIVRNMFNIIEEINKQGMTILLIEQSASMALRIADQGYVLKTGRISLSDIDRELLTDKSMKATYLGEKKK